jgi:zinc transport system substrate-binding protein
MKRWGVVITLLGLALASCSGSGGSESDSVRVEATLYPLQFVAEEVAGGRTEVGNISPPGVEPHDLELAPSQVRDLAEADLVLYIGGGFQPAVEDVLEQVDTRTFDALEGQRLIAGEGDEHGDEEGHEEEAIDPHVWLDPTRLADIGNRIAVQLAEVDPDDAESYEANAGDLEAELADLDKEWKSGLSNCRRDDIVVSHEAFGYLTGRYGLEQVGIAGLDPEAEPSTGRVAEVARFAERNGVTTIFFERAVPRDIAETIAAEADIETAALDPIELPPEGGGDYFSVMNDNLDTLTRALDCR